MRSVAKSSRAQCEASREAAGDLATRCQTRPGSWRGVAKRGRAGAAGPRCRKGGRVPGKALPRTVGSSAEPRRAQMGAWPELAGSNRALGKASPAAAASSAARCQGLPATWRGVAKDVRALGKACLRAAGHFARGRPGLWQGVAKSGPVPGKVSLSWVNLSSGLKPFRETHVFVSFCFRFRPKTDSFSGAKSLRNRCRDFSPFCSPGRRAGDRAKDAGTMGRRGVRRDLAVSGRGRRGVTPSIGVPRRRPSLVRGGGALGRILAGCGSRTPRPRPGRGAAWRRRPSASPW